MIALPKKDEELIKKIMGLSPRLKNGYWGYQYKKKWYKRARLRYQYFHKVKLFSDEVIHHKDGNKENDYIKNLELTSQEKHNSNHHAGLKKPRRSTQSPQQTYS